MDGFGPELRDQTGEVSRNVRDGEEYNKSNHQIHLKRFDLHIEGIQLLTEQNLKITPGHRYGLIGCNGVGKTTLLRHLAAKKIFSLWKDHVNALLVTEPSPIPHQFNRSDDEQSPINFVMNGFTEERYLEQNHENITADDQAFFNTVERLGGFDKANAEALRLLANLGITRDQAENSTIGKLSGGFRMRVSLAQALLVEPQLLLLDEVTNHLDVETSSWLCTYLSTYKNTLIIVTHNTCILDEICTDIIHLKDNSLTQYQGDFTGFMQTRAELLQKQHHLHELHEKERQKIEKTIAYLQEVQNGKGVGKQAHRLQRLGADKTTTGRRWKWSLMGDRCVIPAVVEDKEVTFKIKTDKRINDLPDEAVICRVNGVTAGYDTNPVPILKNITFSMLKGKKTAIVGPNASGKSTLLSVLQASLSEDSPYPVDWIFGSDTRVSHFQQDSILLLSKKQTPIDYLVQQNKGLDPDLALAYLQKHDLSEEQCNLPFKLLSSGQRAKVVLASCFISRPTVLLLDEPTNHLDFASQIGLVEAIKNSDATMLIVTHNDTLIESVCDTTFEIKDHKLIPVSDTFSKWKSLQQAAPILEQAPAATTPQPVAPKPVVGEGVSGPIKTPAVKCRLCKGPHFTHQCSLKKEADIKEKGKEIENKMKAIGDAKAAKAALKTLRYRDKDGVWNVAVDKKTKSLLKKC